MLISTPHSGIVLGAGNMSFVLDSHKHNLLLLQQYLHLQLLVVEEQEKTKQVIEKRQKRRIVRPRRCWVLTWLDRPRRAIVVAYYVKCLRAISILSVVKPSISPPLQFHPFNGTPPLCSLNPELSHLPPPPLLREW